MLKLDNFPKNVFKTISQLAKISRGELILELKQFAGQYNTFKRALEITFSDKNADIQGEKSFEKGESDFDGEV